jgi:hypothetical protein
MAKTRTSLAATLVGGLMNARWMDEVQLMVNSLVLGGCKALFQDVRNGAR